MFKAEQSAFNSCKEALTNLLASTGKSNQENLEGNHYRPYFSLSHIRARIFLSARDQVKCSVPFNQCEPLVCRSSMPTLDTHCAEHTQALVPRHSCWVLSLAVGLLPAERTGMTLPAARSALRPPGAAPESQAASDQTF